MKKILTAILVIAMIASIACVAASADDALVITAGEVEAAPGTTATFEVTISNIGELGMGSFLYTAKVEGLTIAKITPAISYGTNQAGEAPAEEVALMWADASKGVKDAEVVVASYEVEIPADAAIGTEYVITITPDDDPDNFLSFENDPQTGEQAGLGGTGVNGKITVVEPATDTSDTDTDTQPITEPVGTEPVGTEPDESGNNNESQDSGEATGSEAAGSEKEGSDTEKKDDGKKAPQTGDVAIIVVAAMIVALGTAIVVKKVSVK